ncbi:MAG: hypothetical protein ACLS6C_03640 [Clostridia bacterium]
MQNPQRSFFGETNNRNENGYITTDGTKLDFSDHHEGAPGEHRYVDHRDTRGEAAVQVELERYYGGAKALLAQKRSISERDYRSAAPDTSP